MQSSSLDKLAKLATLRDQGIFTEEDFQEQKKKLLELKKNSGILFPSPSINRNH
jgi:hypothetical protein